MQRSSVALVFRQTTLTDPNYVRPFTPVNASAAEWLSADPVLMRDELGVDNTNGLIRRGDGEHRWTDLPILTPAECYAMILTAATRS